MKEKLHTYKPLLVSASFVFNNLFILVAVSFSYINMHVLYYSIISVYGIKISSIYSNCIY